MSLSDDIKQLTGLCIVGQRQSGKTIPVGTRGVLMESGLWMRLFWKRYACPRCQPYVSEFWSWQGLESEDIEWDFDEFMREYHRDVWVTDDDD